MERIKEKRTGWILIASLFFLLPIFFSNSADGDYGNDGGYYDPYYGYYITPDDPNGHYNPPPNPLSGSKAPEKTNPPPSPEESTEETLPDLVDMAKDDPEFKAAVRAARRNGIDTTGTDDAPVQVQVAHFSSSEVVDQYNKNLEKIIDELAPSLTVGGIKQESIPVFDADDIVIITEPGTETNGMKDKNVAVFREINGSLELIFRKDLVPVPIEMGDGTTRDKVLVTVTDKEGKEKEATLTHREERYSLYNEDSYDGTETREGQYFDITRRYIDGYFYDVTTICTAETQKDTLVTTKDGERIWGLEEQTGVRWFDKDGNNVTAAKAKDSTGTVASVDIFYDPATGEQISFNLYDAAGNLLNTPATTNPATPSDLSLRGRRGNPSYSGTSSNAIPPITNKVRNALSDYVFQSNDEPLINWAEATGRISHEVAEKLREIDEEYLKENREQIQRHKMVNVGLSGDQIGSFYQIMSEQGQEAAVEYLKSLGLIDEQISAILNPTLNDAKIYLLSLYDYTTEEIDEFLRRLNELSEQDALDYLMNDMGLSEEQAQEILDMETEDEMKAKLEEFDAAITEEEIEAMITMDEEEFLTDFMGYDEWTVNFILNPTLGESEGVLAVIKEAADKIDFDKTLHSAEGDFGEIQEQAAQRIKEAVLKGLITPSSSVDKVTEILKSILQNLGIQ